MLRALIRRQNDPLPRPSQTTKLQWSQPDILGTAPPGLRGHTATLIGHKILLFGGYDGKGRTNELYILDAQERGGLRCDEFGSKLLDVGFDSIGSFSAFGSGRKYLD